MSHSTNRESSYDALDGGMFQELLESLQRPDAVAAVYRKFIKNAAAFIGELRDQEPLARIETLHTLKGSAAMMGATRMANLAARLEAQGAAVQVAQAMQELEGELASFRTAAAGKLLAIGVSLQ